MIAYIPLDGSASPTLARPPADEIIAVSMTTAGADAIGTSPPSLSQSVHASRSGISLEQAQRFVKWSPYLETVFQQLVSKRALGTLNDDDRAKLGRFRSERRRLKNPLPADQLLRDFKARDLRRKALDALTEYVDFLQETKGQA